MKKSLLFLLINCIAFITYAQQNTYGIRIGANISSLNLDSTEEIEESLEDGRVGAVVGFFAEYYLSNTLRLQPELQFSAQGNKNEIFRVNYLHLPIVLKYHIANIMSIQLGPQAGLKIWEWEDNTRGEANFETFDFSVIGGIGVEVTKNFFVDLRYVYGLTDVFDDKSTLGLEGNHTNIQISFGYKL